MDDQVKNNIPEENEEDGGAIDIDELKRMGDEIDQENRKFYRKAMSFLRRHKKGEKIPMIEQTEHVEWRQYINSLEKAYAQMVKMAKMRGITQKVTPGKMVDMQAVKDEKSSIGAIQRQIPKM